MTTPLLDPTSYPLFKGRTLNDQPAVGYFVYAYEAGSSTPTSTYSNYLRAVANPWPVVLNSQAEATIYLKVATKLVYTDPDGVELWTFDWLFAPGENYFVGTGDSSLAVNNYVVTPSPPATSLTNTMLVMFPDADNVDTIGTKVFTGTGSDDLTPSGPYLGTAAATFTMEIDSVVASIDAYIKLLLHGDDLTDSETTPKTVTVHGDAASTTAEKLLGTGSILLTRATSDYLSLADSADWVLSSYDFTLQCQAYFNDTGNMTFFSQAKSSPTYADEVRWAYESGQIRFYAVSGSSVVADYKFTWVPTTGKWYDLFLVRQGSNLYLFIGDRSVSMTAVLKTWTVYTAFTNVLPDLTGTLNIGYSGVTGYYFNGYLAEVVWSNGIARWTDSFTMLSQEYSTGGVDTIEWKKDGGSWTTLVPITAVAQILLENFTVTFATTTGHVLGDIWAVPVVAPARVNLSSLGNELIYKNKGTYIVALDGGDMKAGYPAQLVQNAAINAWLLINPATPVFKTTTITATRYTKQVSGTYALLLTDQGYNLNFNATGILNLTTVAGFANAFFYVTNSSSGVITVNATSGQYVYGRGDIAGAGTVYIYPGESIQLQSNSVIWQTLTDNAGGLVRVERQVVSGVSIVSFSDLLTGVKYKLDAIFLCTTGTPNVYLRFNGDSGAYYTCNGVLQYIDSVNGSNTGGTNPNYFGTGDTQILIAPLTVGSTETDLSFEFRTWKSDATKVSVNKGMSRHQYYIDANSYPCLFSFNGGYAHTTLSSLAIFLSGGSALTGEFSLYRYT